MKSQSLRLLVQSYYGTPQETRLHCLPFHHLRSSDFGAEIGSNAQSTFLWNHLSLLLHGHIFHPIFPEPPLPLDTFIITPMRPQPSRGGISFAQGPLVLSPAGYPPSRLKPPVSTTKLQTVVPKSLWTYLAPCLSPSMSYSLLKQPCKAFIFRWAVLLL